MKCTIKWKDSSLFKDIESLKLDILQNAALPQSEFITYIADYILDLYYIGNECVTAGDLQYLCTVLIRQLQRGGDKLASAKMSNLRYIKLHVNELQKLEKRTIITSDDAKINFKQTNRLIPLVSDDINQYLNKRFNIDVFLATYYNDEAGIVSPNNIQDAILMYLQKLIRTLCHYLGIKSRFLTDSSGVANAKYYKEVMNAAWQKIQELTKGNPYSAPVTNSDNLKTINFIAAFYQLNNFDDFIKNYSNGLITIDANLYNTLDTPEHKYKRIELHKVNSTYEQTHEDSNPDHLTSKVWKLFFGTISDDNGGYLSDADFTNFTKYIYTALNEKDIVESVNPGLNNYWLFLIDTQYLENLTNLPLYIAERLIQAIRLDTGLHKAMGPKNRGRRICYNIAQKLETFWKHYVECMNDPDYVSSIEDKENLEHEFNFIEIFKTEINNRHTTAFIGASANGADNKSASRITFSKERLSQRMIDLLVKNMKNKDFSLYNPIISINQQGSLIFSRDVLKYINDVTGINLSKEQLFKFSDDINGRSLFTFLFNFTEGVHNQLIPLIREAAGNEATIRELVTNFVQKFKESDTSYLEFSDNYIADNRANSIKLYDQDGNPQPLASLPETLSRFSNNKLDYKKMRGNIETENVILKGRGLTTPIRYSNGQASSSKYLEHIAYRQDVEMPNGQVVKASELSPLESLYTAFNNEFLYFIIHQGTFYNQVECYSDKTRIALAAYNMIKATGLDKSDRAMVSYTTLEVKNLWYTQHKDHYGAVKNLIIHDLKTVLGFLGKNVSNDLDQLISELEKTTTLEFERGVSAYNRANPNNHVDITRLIHYVPSKNPNDFCKFNNTLYFNIKACDGENSPCGELLQRYYNEGLEDLRVKLSSIAIPKFLQNEDFIYKHLDIISGLFDIDFQDSNKVLKLVKFLTKAKDQNEMIYWEATNDDEAEFVDAIINKYYALHALFTDAELFLTTKHNVIHDGKLTQESISRLNANSEFFYNLMKADQSARLVVGKKRNNADVATYIPMSVTTYGGVSRHSKIAIILSSKMLLLNYQGQTEEGQDVHDGAVFTLGIAMFWENLSYPGKTIDSVKKVIGLIPSMSSFMQIKCADFPIDNLALCNAFNNSSPGALNLLNVARKMMRQGKFTESFYSNWDDHTLNIMSQALTKYIGTEVYQISKMEYLGDHRFSIIWSEVNNPDNKLPKQEVVINDAYDLWEAFGGRHSVELVDGDWVPSNNSMRAVANLISEYDPSVKELIVSKIVDVSSNKSGTVNFNLLEDVNNPDDNISLNTTLIDNTRWGMQLDYSHEADESDIPSLTQIINALAFNGKNIKLVANMNEALSQLTLLHAKELGLRANATPEQEFKYFKNLVDDLLYSLATGATRSDALTLVLEAADIMQKYVENHPDEFVFNAESATILDGNLPYSSPLIFYKLASDFISALNKKSIKLTYNGIAIVQNPSVGIVGIYEDNQGNTYKYNDLLEEGREIVRKATENGRYKISPENSEEVLRMTESRFLEIALSQSKFRPIEVSSAEELELEDTIELYSYTENVIGKNLIEKIPGLVLKTIRITNPLILYNIAKEIGPGIGIRKIFTGLRDLKAPKLLFRTMDGKYHNFWFTPATMNRLNPKLKGAERIKAIEFYRANLEALGSKEPFYYPEYGNYNVTAPVQNVEYSPGEQIIPKVNKSALSLGNSSLAQILTEGVGYFRAKIDHSFAKINKVVLEENGTFVATIVRDDLELIYSDIKNIPSGFKEITDLHILVENGIKYVQDSNYKKLFAIPNNCRIYKGELGNKEIYYILSLDPYSENINQVLNSTDKNATYIDPSSDINLLKASSSLNPYIDVNKVSEEKPIQALLHSYAKKLFLSFKLSNYTISGRIPSLAFQSFMANKNAAFMDRGVNNGYVNIYEVLFTGSDFDIDKLYTMLFSLDKTGVIATNSPFSILNSIKTLLKSLELPLPNKDAIIKQYDLTELSEEARTVHITGDDIANSIYNGVLQLLHLGDPGENAAYNLDTLDKLLDDLKDSNDEKDNLLYLLAIDAILTYLNLLREKGRLVSYIASHPLIEKLNAHNKRRITAEGLKNVVVAAVYSCSTDVRNVEASTQPMSMKSITRLIDEVYSESGIPAKQYNNITPLTKFLIQYENSVGKKDVGISANGIKAAGSLQLYMNEYYSEWDGTEDVDDTHKMYMPIRFTDENGRNIISEDFVTLGDVVFDDDKTINKEKFLKLHSKIDVRTQSDYVALQYLRSINWSVPSDVVSNPIAKNYFYYDLKAETYKLRSEYVELKDIYESYITNNPTVDTSSLDGYLDFLYYAKQFRPNVADTLSVFISLATDNAKELALAKIYGNPQLLSIPLAMITLGMKPKQVIDICVNILGPIAKQMEVNRIQNEKVCNIRDLIKSTLKNNTENQQSMLMIYDFAQQLRGITSFFKVNQGVTARYVELLAFCKRLAKTSLTLADIISYDDRSPLNLAKLFDIDPNNEEEVKKEQAKEIDRFNELRQREGLGTIGVNLLDVVIQSKNFSSMLKSMQSELKSLQYIAAAAKFVDVRDFTDIDDGGYNDANNYRKIINVYQDYVIGKTLKSNIFAGFTFNKAMLQKRFSSLDLNIGERAAFGVSTSSDVDLFMNLMDNYVIPSLKDKYGDNFFMSALTLKMNRSLKKLTWQLDYDAFNDEDIAEQQNIHNATMAFREIAKLNSGLVTAFGQEISIGDALYIYDLLAHKGRMSSLNTVVTSQASQVNSKYVKAINDTYIDLDRKSRKDPIAALEEFNQQQISLIQKAVLSSQYSASDELNTKELNLNDAYIWSLVPIKDKKELNKEEFEKQLGVSINKSDDSNNIIIDDKQSLKRFIFPVLNILNPELDLFSQLTSDTKLNIIREIKSYREIRRNILLSSGGLEVKNITIGELLNDLPTSKFPILDLINNSDFKNYTVLVVPQANANGIFSQDPIYSITLEHTAPIIVVSKDLIFSNLDQQNSSMLLDVLLQTSLRNNLATSEEKLKLLEKSTENLDLKILKKIYNTYIGYLRTHAPGQSIILESLNLMNICSQYIINKDVYYTPSLELKKGSIVQFTSNINGVSPFRDYLYIGQIGDEHAFIDIESTQFKIVRFKNISNSIFKSIKSLIVDNLGLYFTYKPGTFNSDSEFENMNKDIPVQQGDIVIIDGVLYSISDIVYYQTKDGNIITRYIGINNTTKDIIGFEDTSLISQIKKSTVYQLANIDPIFKFDLTSGSLSNIVLNNINLGDRVTINNLTFTVKRRINQNIFIDTDNQQQLLQNVTYVESRRNLGIDPAFIHDSALRYISDQGVPIDDYDFNRYMTFIKNSTGYNLLKRGDKLYFYEGNNNGVHNLTSLYVKALDSEYSINDYIVINNGSEHLVCKIIGKNNDVYDILIANVESGLDEKHTMSEFRLSTYYNGLMKITRYGKVITYSIEHNGKKSEYSSNGTHYIPLNKSTLKTDNKLISSLNGLEALEQLAQNAGMKLIIRNTSDSKFHALVLDDNIIIYQPVDISTDNIVQRGIHEFCHVALAYLRAKDQSKYVTIMTALDDLIKSKEITDRYGDMINSILEDTQYYKNTLDKNEEILIRLIDENISNIGENTSYNTIIDIVNNAFRSLFNTDINISNRESLSSVLRNSGADILDFSKSDNKFLAAKRALRLKKMMSKIKEIC